MTPEVGKLQGPECLWGLTPAHFASLWYLGLCQLL